MKKAVIDIGSNSILLLVAQRVDERWEPVHESIEEPRLGDGLVYGGVIKSEAIRRTVDALRRTLELAKKFEPAQIIVAGTSPFRIASNADQVKTEIERACQCKIRVITEPEERALTFVAALKFSGFEGELVQIELGGLTTEITIGNEQKISFSNTFDLGAIRIAEQFQLFPPVSKEVIEKARKSIVKRLPSIILKGNEHLVISGGTITTIACYISGDKKYRSGSYHRMMITKDKLLSIVYDMAKLDIPGLMDLLKFAPSRADIILAGSVGIVAIMDWLKKDELFVSERGLRWGLLLRG